MDEQRARNLLLRIDHLSNDELEDIIAEDGLKLPKGEYPRSYLKGGVEGRLNKYVYGETSSDYDDNIDDFRNLEEIYEEMNLYNVLDEYCDGRPDDDYM